MPLVRCWHTHPHTHTKSHAQPTTRSAENRLFAQIVLKQWSAEQITSISLKRNIISPTFLPPTHTYRRRLGTVCVFLCLLLGEYVRFCTQFRVRVCVTACSEVDSGKKKERNFFNLSQILPSVPHEAWTTGKNSVWALAALASPSRHKTSSNSVHINYTFICWLEVKEDLKTF